MNPQRKVSPFPVAVRKTDAHVDVSMLAVEHNTPVPISARSGVRSKYEELFAQLKPGSCIVCEADERGRIVAALGKHIERKGLPYCTKSLGRCTDGHARVWMVKK